MIYIFRPKFSEGAEELAYALSEAGLRTRYIRKERPLAPGDRLICWGTRWPVAVPPGVEVLNNVAGTSKFTDAVTLKSKGVPTVEVSRQMQRDVPGVKAPLVLPQMTLATPQDAARVLAQVDAWSRLPVPPGATWLPRIDNHIGGNDLLRTPQRPDYWSKKVQLTGEVRIHSFLGKSIRAGQKKIGGPNAGRAHQWIRSFDGGWIIAYENFSATEAQRELAANAVEALGLQFGAVDIGILPDASPMVLEVNRAPGIEGGSIEAYVKAIKRWTGVEVPRQRRAA